MTPEEFKEKMDEIRAIGYEEDCHIYGDKLMCELLRSLGYGDGVEIFEKMPKWYS